MFVLETRGLRKYQVFSMITIPYFSYVSNSQGKCFWKRSVFSVKHLHHLASDVTFLHTIFSLKVRRIILCKSSEKLQETEKDYIQAFYIFNVFLTLTFSWIELQMLLRCYLIHLTVIIFVFTLFVYISRPRSIYAESMWFFISISILIMISFIISWKHTIFFFCLVFWMISWMKNVNNFQMAKI